MDVQEDNFPQWKTLKILIEHVMQHIQLRNLQHVKRIFKTNIAQGYNHSLDINCI